MKLNILTWNINFIHDNWYNRMRHINKRLERDVNNYDIVALQEATLPFNNAINEVYNFLNNKNNNYFPTAFVERNRYIDNIINYIFTKYKLQYKLIFEWILNKLLWISGYVFSVFGEYLKELYFSNPTLFIILIFLCPPIFIGSWMFIGMITIINKKILTTVKSKYIGKRLIQYSDFVFNNREIRFCNVHLSPGNKQAKSDLRYLETKELVKMCKSYENVILAGDFNAKPNKKFYKYLKKHGYKSVQYECNTSNGKTFPSDNPTKCIDYIWIKGENIKAVSCKLFGDSKHTDHKGIKCTLDIV